ncbi:MAG: fumarylacetoacetate hydrolase family protein [bacterium]|nr:hypothetical protein [Gammaproteobacteria bacterium]HIL96962.1 hypothetical protein [Pseudomonadales bacterium]
MQEIGKGDRLTLDTTQLMEPIEVMALTSEISHQAEAAFAWLESSCPLKPGTVIGLGTIPGCTGLDFDDFLDPGDGIEISFERLGTLHCQFAEPQAKLAPSRWPVRPELKKYFGL